MLKFGNISEVDASKGLARVKFTDDDMVSGWLPVLVLKSKDDSYSFAFDVDEHVACHMDERCEMGYIAGAIYDSNKKPDGGNADKLRVKFKDGTIMEYDRSAKKLTVDAAGDVVIKAAQTITFNDGSNGGLCKKESVAGKLKALEQKHDLLNTYVGALPIPVSGSVSGPAIPANVQGFAINNYTAGTDLENTKVKH